MKLHLRILKPLFNKKLELSLKNANRIGRELIATKEQLDTWEEDYSLRSQIQVGRTKAAVELVHDFRVKGDSENAEISIAYAEKEIRSYHRKELKYKKQRKEREDQVAKLEKSWDDEREISSRLRVAQSLLYSAIVIIVVAAVSFIHLKTGSSVDMNYYLASSQILIVIFIALYIDKNLSKDKYTRSSWEKLDKVIEGLVFGVFGLLDCLIALGSNHSNALLFYGSIVSLVFMFFLALNAITLS